MASSADEPQPVNTGDPPSSEEDDILLARCPNCSARCAIDAVLCAECGYHFATGRVLMVTPTQQTGAGASSGEEAASDEIDVRARVAMASLAGSGATRRRTRLIVLATKGVFFVGFLCGLFFFVIPRVPPLQNVLREGGMALFGMGRSPGREMHCEEKSLSQSMRIFVQENEIRISYRPALYLERDYRPGFIDAEWADWVVTNHLRLVLNRKYHLILRHQVGTRFVFDSPELPKKSTQLNHQLNDFKKFEETEGKRYIRTFQNKPFVLFDLKTNEEVAFDPQTEQVESIDIEKLVEDVDSDGKSSDLIRIRPVGSAFHF